MMLAQVADVDVEHQGTYWCHVFNDREDEDSKKIEVIIGKEFFYFIQVSSFVHFFHITKNYF